MPEVPSNMQQDLANLELEARMTPSHPASSTSTMSSHSTHIDSYPRDPQTSGSSQTNMRQRSAVPGFTASYENTNASAYQNLNRRSLQQFTASQPDSPRFSPFPKLHNAGENVPLSDDEKEEVLERARPLVLKSTDPEMQLAWAQDALSWVEVASQNSSRQQQLDGGSQRPVTPKVEHQLRVDALNIVTFLAEQHHPKAQFMQGMWLEFGKFGYRVDKKEAFMAYRRAAERGYARAEYRIGMQYESSNNPTKAIEHYQKGVAANDSASDYRLGMMTLLGQHGMPRDYERGVNLIRFAADTADENAPQGAYVYGMLLARELPNISVPEQYLPYDVKDAKYYIEKAAYLGFAKAQLKMGQAYELCQLDCEFDPALSLHYNALAARQGEAEAEMAISKWFLCGYEGIFEKNEELAFTYAQRAAQTKMATAEFALGYFYEIGVYVPIDLVESEKWYKKAADHGNNDAIGRIDSIKKNNTFSKKDHEQIALSRIKSQYGSQRGGRPERFKKPVQQMPAMAESVVNMPDPRNPYRVSTAPYPDDDASSLPAQHPNPQYYNQGGRPSSAAGPQADRPSSAFGVVPLHHTATDPYSYNGSVNAPEPLRLPNNMGPGGRGANRVASAGWEPQTSELDQGRNRLVSAPQININNRPQPQNVQSLQPLPNTGYNSDPSRQPRPQSRGDSPAISIPRRDLAANHLQHPERRSSMTPVNGRASPASPASQRPARIDSMQPSRLDSPSSPYQNTMGPGRASPRPQQPNSPQTPAPAPVSHPPKKAGPATFEEMGIPVAKHESDCVRLPLLQFFRVY